MLLTEELMEEVSRLLRVGDTEEATTAPNSVGATQFEIVFTWGCIEALATMLSAEKSTL